MNDTFAPTTSHTSQGVLDTTVQPRIASDLGNHRMLSLQLRALALSMAALVACSAFAPLLTKIRHVSMKTNLDLGEDDASTVNTEKVRDSIEFRPVFYGQDQALIWDILRLAAHAETLEEVQTNPLISVYGNDFGSKPGDIGVVAEEQGSEENINSGVGVSPASKGIPMAAAWVRYLPGTGFATSHLMDGARTNDENREDIQLCLESPELAIACFPEYQGQGLGTKLLSSLLSRVEEETDYPGVCLSCFEDNAAAMKLYHRCGFLKISGSQYTNDDAVGPTTWTLLHRFDQKRRT